MKRFITLICLFPMFLMAGCDWFEEADLLEVYFGIRQNITSVDTTTNFYYEIALINASHDVVDFYQNKTTS